MQHDALYGTENRNYTKAQDTPDATTKPPQASGNSAIVPVDEFSSPTDPVISDLPDSSSLPTEDLDSDLEIVETAHFDLPLPHPTANKAFFEPTEATAFDDLAANEFITDHLQYLAYNS